MSLDTLEAERSVLHIAENYVLLTIKHVVLLLHCVTSPVPMHQLMMSVFGQ